jgi:hypothetical protein
MFKSVLIASAVAIATSSAALASTIGGSVTINIFQSTNTNTATASATDANIAASTYLDTITYTGFLDFGTFTQNNNPPDTTTIAQWLDTGVGGSYTGLDGSVGDLQLSKPDIGGSGTATTTFFEFLGLADAPGFTFDITHDDGFSFFDDGAAVASNAGPTSQTTQSGIVFDGGEFRLIYAATNGDPSVLKLAGQGTLAPVPLPAAGFLLVGALGGLAAVRRRRKAS